MKPLKPYLISWIDCHTTRTHAGVTPEILNFNMPPLESIYAHLGNFQNHFLCSDIIYDNSTDKIHFIPSAVLKCTSRLFRKRKRRVRDLKERALIEVIWNDSGVSSSDIHIKLDSDFKNIVLATATAFGFFLRASKQTMILANDCVEGRYLTITKIPFKAVTAIYELGRRKK